MGMFESRLTRSFGRGAVWLAGDAAHLAAPVGVQSMNSGIVEARELAVRIARVLRGGGSTALLEEFARETDEAWRRLLGAGRAGARPRGGTSVGQTECGEDCRLRACVG